MALDVRRLTENIGAEVIGLDLTEPLDDDSKAELDMALAENVVLVFRDQEFDRPQFRDAVLLFGEPKYQLLQQYLYEDTPEIG
ncbi:MAG TPA: taurine dioxygenase, partial [Rhodospirillaceae bacterium]|nr:taurine dioxygenase [Rhodospirillaceae bacterium]